MQQPCEVLGELRPVAGNWFSSLTRLLMAERSSSILSLSFYICKMGAVMTACACHAMLCLCGSLCFHRVMLGRYKPVAN